MTLIANYLPLQDPYGGPNYFKLDPNALYEIHIDNDGDADEDMTFQFRFQTSNDDNKFNVGGEMVSIPLVQNGSGDVATTNSSALNVHEKLHDRSDSRRPRSGSAAAAVTNLTRRHDVRQAGRQHRHQDHRQLRRLRRQAHLRRRASPAAAPARVFVGQRKDPFVVNLGEIVRPRQRQVSGGRLNPAAEFDDASTPWRTRTSRRSCSRCRSPA